MQLITFTALATLVIRVQCAIVGAPVGVENPFAIELESTPNQNLAPRDNDPLECDGWCCGEMHCCLIADIYSRCHSINTPCSKLSFPDALSAPAPHPVPETSPTGLASPGNGTVSESCNETSTVAAPTQPRDAGTTAETADSAGLEAKEQRIAPRSNPLEGSPFTGTTLHVVTETAATILTVPILPIPSGVPASPAWPSHLTTEQPSALTDQYTTAPIPYISAFTSVIAATAVPGTHTSDNTSIDTASTLNTPSLPITLTTTFSLPSALPSSTHQNTADTEHTHNHDHQSTVTSVTSVASTTITSTASLNNEASAIATTVGEGGADGVRVPMSAVGLVDGVLLLGFIGLGMVVLVV